MIWALLLSAVPFDPVGDPLERYLDLDDVTVALKGVAPKLEDCSVGEDVTVSLTMDWSGDGRVGSFKWEPESYVAVSCWQDALSAHQFMRHDDAPERVRTSVYVRDGAFLFSPSPALEQRTIGPLLLFVSGGEDVRSQVELYIAGTETEEQ